MKPIYFDYAATTPVDQDVVKVMQPYYHDTFANASSPHTLGQKAQAALEDARQTLAGAIHAEPEEIIFTSGATEANNHALLGSTLFSRIEEGNVITSSVEHHSVLKPAYRLKPFGFETISIPVDETCLIDVNALKNAITPDTRLISIILANNEVGTIQPVKEVSHLARQAGVPLHVDAVQVVGHLPIDVKEMQVDLLSLSAHKFYGPKGIGALFVRRGIKLENLLVGGDQERNRRASTQNVVGAVGMAAAISGCMKEMENESKEQTRLRDRLINEIPQSIPDVKVNGHLLKRLPNNVHVTFNGVSAERLLIALDMHGIAASSGSACTSGVIEPSHVLIAMGLTEAEALSSIRFSLGRWTIEEHIDHLLNVLPTIVKRLRSSL